MLMSPKTSNIQDVLDAALRLLAHDYPDWARSGGPNECQHGIAEGIACKRCDEAIVRAYRYVARDYPIIPDPAPAVHKYIDRHKYVPAPFGSRRP